MERISSQTCDLNQHWDRTLSRGNQKTYARTRINIHVYRHAQTHRGRKKDELKYLFQVYKRSHNGNELFEGNFSMCSFLFHVLSFLLLHGRSCTLLSDYCVQCVFHCLAATGIEMEFLYEDEMKKSRLISYSNLALSSYTQPFLFSRNKF